MVIDFRKLRSTSHYFQRAGEPALNLGDMVGLGCTVRLFLTCLGFWGGGGRR